MNSLNILTVCCTLLAVFTISVSAAGNGTNTNSTVISANAPNSNNVTMNNSSDINSTNAPDSTPTDSGKKCESLVKMCVMKFNLTNEPTCDEVKPLEDCVIAAENGTGCSRPHFLAYIDMYCMMEKIQNVSSAQDPSCAAALSAAGVNYDKATGQVDQDICKLLNTKAIQDALKANCSHSDMNAISDIACGGVTGGAQLLFLDLFVFGISLFVLGGRLDLL